MSSKLRLAEESQPRGCVQARLRPAVSFWGSTPSSGPPDPFLPPKEVLLPNPAVMPASAPVPAGSLRDRFSVFVAEDSDDDYWMVEQAFRHSQHLRLIGRASDGEEAMAYLKGAGPYADRQLYPLPDLLLLDLKMPRQTGFEILQWLRSQSLKGLVVVVLTGSLRREDMTQALSLGAHFYQQKPFGREGHLAMMKQLEYYLLRNNNR